MDQIALSKMLDKCVVYVNQRLTEKRPWELWDMYRMMDEFKIPYDQMHEYFPPPQKQVQEKGLCKVTRLNRKEPLKLKSKFV